MKRFVVGAAALMLAFVAPATAQTASVAAETLQPVNPALFVARDEDSTIYLFGTVHMRRPGFDWGGANARAALAEAEEVWTEVDMSATGRFDAERMIWRYGIAQPGQPLSSFLSEEERAQLATAARRYNAAPEMFESMRPWFAAITLSMLPMLQDGYASNAGVDNMIDALVDETGKGRRAFETAEEQIRFIADMSLEAQREMLLEAISETENGTEQIDALADAWARGDLAFIEQEVIDTETEYPEVYEAMLVRRNNAWIAQLMQEMEGSGVDFIAVGAAHLVGEHGLVEQLRARGVTVERVSPAE